MKNFCRNIVLASGASWLMIVSAQAGLLTESDALITPTVIDFSAFNGTFSYTSGPISVGGAYGLDVSWQTSYGSSVIGSGGYNLGGNGLWNNSRTFTGLVTDTGFMTFSFNDGPMSAVGGFMNYFAGNDMDVIIEALAADNTVLEGYNISAVAPVQTPGGTNEGAFRGIARSVADIFGFRVWNSRVVLDDLTFSDHVVTPPDVEQLSEPASLAFLGLGLAGLGLMRKRRH